MENNNIVKPAGFWIRLLARIVDSVVLTLPIPFIIIFQLEGWLQDFFPSIIIILYYLIVPVYWYGYTIGKRLFGIRIVKINGESPSFITIFLRHIVASLIYLITFGIAIIISAFMIGIRKDKRSIHDFIAGTYVTYLKP
jgi:uncharacterized RDD family membrane protein YckC